MSLDRHLRRAWLPLARVHEPLNGLNAPENFELGRAGQQHMVVGAPLDDEIAAGQGDGGLAAGALGARRH